MKAPNAVEDARSILRALARDHERRLTKELGAVEDEASLERDFVSFMQADGIGPGESTAAWRNRFEDELVEDGGR